ncbi:MAG TPA: DivIVA domain-containing protein [Nitriliruptorales bacterium]
MEAWILVTVVVFVTGAAVIATLFTEDSPLRHPGLRGEPDQPIRPIDLRSVSFPTRFRGYDPVLVDQWLTAAADALEMLSDTAGPELVALAEDRFGDNSRTPGANWPVETDTPLRDGRPVEDTRAVDDVTHVEDLPPTRPIDLLSRLPMRDTPPDPGPSHPPRFDPSNLH